MIRSVVASLIALTLLPIATAEAIEPVMPLSEVRAGMRCEGLSVISGTTPTTFNVDVLDVLAQPPADTAKILIRVSGAAVDATGAGQGFSGSPFLCPRADGTRGVAGAISYGIGEYGDKTLLATPIEVMLGQPIEPKVVVRSAMTRARQRALLARARPLAEPLTISGVTPRVGALLSAAATKAGRHLLVAPPAGLRQTPAPAANPFALGSTVVAGLSTGGLAAGALGTVSYVNQNDVYAFGHPFDGAGRRSLFLQTGAVSTVIFNPIGAESLTTYKLGAPTGDVGTLSGDGPNAVTGRVGALPPSYPLRVTSKDLDTGRQQSLVSKIADESDLGQPTGLSGLGIVATGSAGTLATTALTGGTPGRVHGEACVRLTLREVTKPMRYCNRYVFGAGSLPGAAVVPIMADVAASSSILETYAFGALHPTDVQVAVRLQRGTAQEFLTSIDGPSQVRGGQRITLRLGLRRAATGQRRALKIQVRVPRGMPHGERLLTIEGPGADAGSGDSGSSSILASLFGDEEDAGASDPGPRTPEEVASAIEDLERYDGLTAAFLSPDSEPSEEGESLPSGPEGIAERPRDAYRDKTLRISGGVQLPVEVTG